MLGEGTQSTWLAALVALVLGALVGWLMYGVVEAHAEGLLRAAASGRRRLRLRAASGLVLGVAWAGLTVRSTLLAQTLELCLFAAVLLHLSLTDLDCRSIPNADIVAGCAIRLVYLVLAGLLGWPEAGQAWFYLGSALAVLLVLLATVLVADRLLGTESMGGGDLKLFATCALYVGWLQSLLLVFLACLLGLASSLPLMREQAGEGQTTITFPFGPSIALACLICLLVGPCIGIEALF